MDRSALTVTRHSSPLGDWEMTSSGPDPRLLGLVRDYHGYRESATGFIRRRELPSGDVTLILGLGAPIDVSEPAHPHGPLARHGSFVAALHERWVLTEMTGPQAGIEIRLSPPGARRLLGVPMHTLANRVIGLEELLGPGAGRLVEAVAQARSWERRFDVLDAFLARRLARAPGSGRREIDWAWRRLVGSGGRVAIADLADEVGFSRRRLADGFREQIGLRPKTTARILRFQRAVERLGRDDGTSFAEIAQTSGYSDQAHLNRDFRAFAGESPGSFVGRLLPDGAGISGH